MTNAYEIFKQSIIEAKDLLECFITLNSHSELTAPDALKKASLILALTAWETYVEDVITEIFNVKFSMVKGSMLGNFADKQLKELTVEVKTEKTDAHGNVSSAWYRPSGQDNELFDLLGYGHAAVEIIAYNLMVGHFERETLDWNEFWDFVESEKLYFV